MDKIKKFAMPGLAVLATIALIVGLVSAFSTTKADASDLAAIQAQVTDLQTAVAQLDANMASATDMAALQAQVANLEAITTQLLNTPQTVSASELAILTAQIADLQASIYALQSPAPTAPAPAAPTAEPIVASGRFETAPCNDDAQRWFNAADANYGAVWHVTCFAVSTALQPGENYDQVYDESLHSMIATPYGAAIVEAYISYGGGDQPTAWLMWSANRDNAGTAAPYAVTLTSPFPAWVTLGELMTELHPIGPAHQGLWVFVRYIDLDPTDNMGVKGIELTVP